MPLGKERAMTVALNVVALAAIVLALAFVMLGNDR
jgi:hypothetical protein